MRVRQDCFALYPHVPGDVWKSQDGDVLVAGDALNPEIYGKVPNCKLIYVDPPWGNALLTAFRKVANETKQTWPEFLSGLAKMLRDKCSGYLFMEMGNRWVEEVIGVLMGKFGFDFEYVYNITYSKNRPCNLIQFRLPEIEPLGYIEGLTGEDDSVTPGIVMDAVGVDAVLDPMFGMGTTAKNAWSRGIKCYGIELSPHRLAVALDIGRKKFKKVWTKVL